MEVSYARTKFRRVQSKPEAPPRRMNPRTEGRASSRGSGSRSSSMPNSSESVRLPAQGRPHRHSRRLEAGGSYQFDESGKLASVRLILSVTGEARWKTESKPYPYGIWELGDARKADYVVIVDSEAAVDVLRYHGIPAIGLIGADAWPSAWDVCLDRISRIYVPALQIVNEEGVRLNIPELYCGLCANVSIWCISQSPGGT